MAKGSQKVEHGDVVYYRPWMYDKQEKAIFNDCRYAVCEASTKSGKTVGCIVWLFEQALKGEPGYNYWWVAPVSTQADIAWERMKQAVPGELYEKNETKKRMDLANGTSIWFKTGDAPDSLYGEDVYAAVIDEASRVKEESWHAVRSTLTATKGPVRIIGNVKGKKNWAYRFARRAQQKMEEGDERFHYAKITAYDAAEAGVLDWKEIEDAKETYPENVFKELYLAEPAGDEGNPFGAQHIRNCIMRKENGRPYFAENDFILDDTQPVCWGWDIAKHVNWTVGIGLDSDGRVCRYARFQDSYEATLRKVISNTSGLPALVDSTSGSGGDQLLERLQREGGENFEGYKFSTGSKQNLMIGLAVVIQNGDISYPDGRIVQELESFEYDQRRTNVVYSAPEGQHDDCVDALAMAVKHWRSRSRFPADAAPISFDRVSPWNI